ncbi:MAG: chemotaxis protein CheD [Elusimicrobia bacterium]|nr:chemotaxis protein CheD [Elusimicrobiota bacterium]
MDDPIKVGIADLKVSAAPNKIVTNALGSCVAIVLYDVAHRIGGLAHIMLPTTAFSKIRSNPAKFADTAIPEMLIMMKRLGATKATVSAKIIGGAQMFANVLVEPLGNIGLRNVQAAKEALAKESINIIAEDTGGDCGKSVEIDLNNGGVTVRSIKYGINKL